MFPRDDFALLVLLFYIALVTFLGAEAKVKGRKVYCSSQCRAVSVHSWLAPVQGAWQRGSAEQAEQAVRDGALREDRTHTQVDNVL